MSEELRHYCRGGGGCGPVRRARECGAQHRRAPGGHGRAQNVPGGDERDSNAAARGPTHPNPIIERTDGEFFALPYKIRPCVRARHPEFYGKIYPEFFGNGRSWRAQTFPDTR